jgi:hypothetical protein
MAVGGVVSMSRAGFGALVAAVVVIAFGATWFVSARPSGDRPRPAAAAPLGAPLAPASSGRLQCYGPNVTQRTCQSLAGYATGAGGEIENTASAMVLANPLVVMRTVSPVTIKAEQVCGEIREQDVQSADFTVDGAPATTVQSARLRAKMLAAMQRLLGRQICTAYVPAGGSFVATATVDGVRDPNFDQRVVWVSRGDGYSVGP